MEVGSRVPTKILDLPAKVRVEVPTKAPDGRRMCESESQQRGFSPDICQIRLFFFSWNFLVLLPKDKTVKTFRDHVEIGFRAYSLFRDLEDEKEPLSKAVASLNTVRRKGKGNIHILELHEDDGDED
ncbi:hypothetical protein DFH06DRAFT_1118564 [Mycena polygramma]|nr:hypothetical protein DFH06DRAFT_1118564 [Mycena polygramma]